LPFSHGSLRAHEHEETRKTLERQSPVTRNGIDGTLQLTALVSRQRRRATRTIESIRVRAEKRRVTLERRDTRALDEGGDHHTFVANKTAHRRSRARDAYDTFAARQSPVGADVAQHTDYETAHRRIRHQRDDSLGGVRGRTVSRRNLQFQIGEQRSRARGTSTGSQCRNAATRSWLRPGY
jgi:hypothetical protein